jgi:Family of unknown function (DUF5715)
LVARRIRVKPLGWVVISLTGLIISFLVLSGISPRDRNEGFRWYINKKLGRECIPYRQSVFSRRLKDMLPDYIARSSAEGIDKCSNRRELMKKAAKGEVYRTRNSRGFVIEDLTHSYPYLTRDGKILLKEIGRRFRKKVAGTSLRRSDFMVTSVTRTTEAVRKLRKSNTNVSGNSPHFYGNAFDISYVRFRARKWFVTDCDKYYLKEALAEVIWQLREEKKCWATYEINQGCFHVVAR